MGKEMMQRDGMDTRQGRTAYPLQPHHCQLSTKEGKGLDKPRQK